MSTALSAASAAPPARPAARRRRLSRFADEAYRRALGALAGLVFVAVALIVYETARGSLPAIQTLGWRFLIGQEWDPVADHYGALPYVFGTLVSSALAMLMAVPFGIGTAIFLAEIAPPRVGEVVSFVPLVGRHGWAK